LTKDKEKRGACQPFDFPDEWLGLSPGRRLRLDPERHFPSRSKKLWGLGLANGSTGIFDLMRFAATPSDLANARAERDPR